MNMIPDTQILPRLSNPTTYLVKPPTNTYVIDGESYTIADPIDTWFYETVSDSHQYLNGFADDTSGTVEHVGHVYRVDNRLITTDSVGSSITYVYASISHAEAVMVTCHAQEAAWDLS